MWGHALCASGRSVVEGRGDRDTREALANRLRDVLALVERRRRPKCDAKGMPVIAPCWSMM